MEPCSCWLGDEVRSKRWPHPRTITDKAVMESGKKKKIFAQTQLEQDIYTQHIKDKAMFFLIVDTKLDSSFAVLNVLGLLYLY